MVFPELINIQKPLITTFVIARNVVQRSDEAISFSPSFLCRDAFQHDKSGGFLDIKPILKLA